MKRIGMFWALAVLMALAAPILIITGIGDGLITATFAFIHLWKHGANKINGDL